MSRASNLSRHARKGVHQVQAAAHHIKSTADGHVATIGRTLRGMQRDAVGAVKEGMGQLGETASDYVRQGKRKARSMEVSAQRTIKQRPITWVLGAIGIGFLAGRFFARR